MWSLPYVYLHALQIYLDFSAYTDIARGLALFFGFRWPERGPLRETGVEIGIASSRAAAASPHAAPRPLARHAVAVSPRLLAPGNGAQPFIYFQF